VCLKILTALLSLQDTQIIKDKILKTKRFEIAAFAATKPIDTNSTSKGRAKNRRVEIMLDYSQPITVESPNDGVSKALVKEAVVTEASVKKAPIVEASDQEKPELAETSKP